MTDRLPPLIPDIGDDGSIPLQSRSPALHGAATAADRAHNAYRLP